MQGNKMDPLEKARDPVTGRLSFGMMGNLVPDLLQKDVRQDDSRGYRFFDEKTRQIVESPHELGDNSPKIPNIRIDPLTNCSHDWKCRGSNDYAEDTFRCTKCGKVSSNEGTRFL
jgi:hypothetical protein